MSELFDEQSINGLIKEHLENYAPNIRDFCLLAIDRARELPVPDVVEILRTSAKDFIEQELGRQP
jgi:hypothetical protein